MAFSKAGRYNEILLSMGSSGVVTLLPLTSVRVYPAGAAQVPANLATLYTNKDKGGTLSNPVLSDTYGNLAFYADPGLYDLVVNGVTVPSVPVDPDAAEALGYATVQEEGASLTQRPILNFVGMATATDDAGNGRTNVTITDPVPPHVALADPHGQYRLESVLLVDADVATGAAIAETKLNLASDAAAGTASRRTLGTGATQAAAGNDARFTTVTANRQTANYTLVLADAAKAVEMNVGTANTLTVPPNSSVAFPVGTVIEGLQYGAGQTTITPGAGVTIRASGGKLKTAAQYSQFALRKLATDEWLAAGDLVV